MPSPVLLFPLILVNSILFATLGLSAALVARRGPTPVSRKFALVLSAVCAVLFLGSLERLALQAVRAGWAAPVLREFKLSYWEYGQAVAAVSVGIWAVRVTSALERPLLRAERVVEVLTDQIPLSVSVSKLALTSRELNVIEVISSGKLSDREIADALYISPVTVGTHVQNILRKAGIHNRRELLLVAGLETEPGKERP